MIISDSQLLLGKNNNKKKKPRDFYKEKFISNLQGCKKTHFETVNNATQQQHLPARSTLQNELDEIASSVTALSAGRISKLEQDPRG